MAVMKKWGVHILLMVLFVGMMILNFLNEGTLGGADSYMHHMIAKWAFTHPKLFFDQWGKPMFTIFSAPFALLGFKGSVTFNILTSLFSGFLVYKTAKKIGLDNAWFGIIMTVFAPMFFMMAFTSMTEIIFAFNLILAIYLFVDQKYIWSAMAISFIPFARTEGIIFFPLFLLALLGLKQYKSVPLLLFGYVLMSLLGYSFMDDIWWPITTMPYGDSSGLYGSGKLIHFVEKSPDIFGWPLIVTFCLGLGAIMAFLVGKFSKKNLAFIFLILSCSIGYFAAHSVVWAFGLGGSFGLIRVISGIIPLVALVSIWGVNMLANWMKPSYVNVFLGMVTIVFIVEAFTKREYPIPLGAEEKLYDKVAQFVNDQHLNENYIVYYNPYGAFAMKLDHFSWEDSRNQVYDREMPSSNFPKNTIIVWDAHFSPNEGGLPKQNLFNDDNLTLLKGFQPEHPFDTWKGDPFEILVFQKK
ncbi:MAG: hypothetical protein ACPGRC_04855 [Salibacteraceae bacterium]